MKKLNVFRALGVALGCAAMLLTSISVSAADIRANAGTTFVVYYTDTEGVFSHTVDGVVQVSLLGNCKVHFDVTIVAPATADDPYGMNGTITITSADGSTTLNANLVGYGTLDPANASFLNIHYEVAFTGGSGAFTKAGGHAEIDGFAMFTNEGLATPDGPVYATGKATWTMKGIVQAKK